MRFVSIVGVLTALVVLAYVFAPRGIAHGAGDTMAVVLAGGVFTIALAVYIRE